MRRRRKHSQFHEPSLVPLADMLTNTVGIMVFILIFTVLTAGGVVVMKRLPIESRVKAKPLFFVCTKGRILPFDSGLIGKFLDPLGKPASLEAASAWVEKYNAQRVSDDYFTITGQGELKNYGYSGQLDLWITITPQAGAGETLEDLKRDGSRFRQILKEHSPQDAALIFIVYPDSLDTFIAARALAADQNYGVGWDPQGANETMREHLTGGGGGGLDEGIVIQ